MTRFLALVAALFVSATAWGAALPRESAVPGGIAIIPLTVQAKQASYGGRRVMIIPHDNRPYAVVGIPLGTQPGKHALTVTTPDGRRSIAFVVNDKQYAVQRLTIKDQAKVTLSPEDLERVRQERKIIDAVYASWTAKRYGNLPFALPVEGVETSEFGLRRILNGEPRSPHSGIDIAAPTGTPVRAPANGIVAEVDNFFFNGNTVIINHGQGLVSVYIHLSNIKVREGDPVRRGQILAEVGSTGRTTGANLHWTVTLNGAKINPELLLSREALASLQ